MPSDQLRGVLLSLNFGTPTHVQVVHNCVPVAQLVEHQVVMRKDVSLTLAGPTLRVLK